MLCFRLVLLQEVTAAWCRYVSCLAFPTWFCFTFVHTGFHHKCLRLCVLDEAQFQCIILPRRCMIPCRTEWRTALEARQRSEDSHPSAVFVSQFFGTSHQPWVPSVSGSTLQESNLKFSCHWKLASSDSPDRPPWIWMDMIWWYGPQSWRLPTSKLLWSRATVSTAFNSTQLVTSYRSKYTRWVGFVSPSCGDAMTETWPNKPPNCGSEDSFVAWIMAGPESPKRQVLRTSAQRFRTKLSPMVVLRQTTSLRRMNHMTTLLRGMMSGSNVTWRNSHRLLKPCIYGQVLQWRICILENPAHQTCRSTKARCPDRNIWPSWVSRFLKYMRRPALWLLKRQELRGNSTGWMKFEANFRSCRCFIHQSD